MILLVKMLILLYHVDLLLEFCRWFFVVFFSLFVLCGVFWGGRVQVVFLFKKKKIYIFIF